MLLQANNRIVILLLCFHAHICMLKTHRRKHSHAYVIIRQRIRCMCSVCVSMCAYTAVLYTIVPSHMCVLLVVGLVIAESQATCKIILISYPLKQSQALLYKQQTIFSYFSFALSLFLSSPQKRISFNLYIFYNQLYKHQPT